MRSVRPKSRTIFSVLPHASKDNHEEQKHRLINIVPYLPVVAAVLGGGFLIYNRSVARVQAGKDSFGVFIRDQISALPNTGVREFYDRTKPDIKKAVGRMLHFLPSNQRDGLDRLWQEYDEIPDKDLSADRENEHGTSWNEGLVEALGGDKVPYPKHPRDLLKEYFDEFYKFSA